MAALSSSCDSCSVNQEDKHLPLSSDEEDEYEDQQLGLERAKEFIVWTVGKIADTFVHLMQNGFMGNDEVQIVLITVGTLRICYAILDEETDDCDEESNIDSDECCAGPSDDQHIESKEENSYYDEVSDSNPNEHCEGRSNGQHIESDEDMEEVHEYRGIEGAKSVLEKVVNSLTSSTVKIIKMHMEDSEEESDYCVIFTCITCVCMLAAFYSVLLAEEEEDDSEEESDDDSDESCESASDVETIVKDEQKDVIEKEEQNAGETLETVSNSSPRPPIPTSSQRVIGSKPKRNADEENSVGLVSSRKRQRT